MDIMDPHEDIDDEEVIDVLEPEEEEEESY